MLSITTHITIQMICSTCSRSNPIRLTYIFPVQKSLSPLSHTQSSIQSPIQPNQYLWMCEKMTVLSDLFMHPFLSQLEQSPPKLLFHKKKIFFTLFFGSKCTVFKWSITKKTFCDFNSTSNDCKAWI